MADAVIAFSGGIAFAELIKAQTCYMAIGSGLADWDALPAIPQPDRTRTTLHNELARLVATVQYLDDTNQVTVSPTRRMEFSGSFGLGVGNGTIREVGVFVGGTAAINSGRLLALSAFTAINKPAGGGDFSLARALRVFFF